MSDSADVPLNEAQANFDSYLGAVILQSFVSGMYSLLMYRTFKAAAPSLRKGSNIFLMLVLVVLYVLVMANVSVGWSVARHTFISNNETREDMTNWLFFSDEVSILNNAATGCGIMAILIADALLAWRCYMLWSRNKILLAFFTLLLLAELGLIPVILKHPFLAGKVPIISVYFFISMGITVLATGLIAYRVITVSRGAVYETEYHYIVEVLVESGLLYSAILFITSVVQALTNRGLNLFQAGTYLTGILTPVTGIAPTLISNRIFSHTEQDEEKWSKPAGSVLVFSTIHKRNVGSATLNNPTQTDLGVATKSQIMMSADIEKQSVGNESPELEFAAVPSPASPSAAPRVGNESLVPNNGFL
jgi:hypothetical protein